MLILSTKAFSGFQFGKSFLLDFNYGTRVQFVVVLIFCEILVVLNVFQLKMSFNTSVLYSVESELGFREIFHIINSLGRNEAFNWVFFQEIRNLNSFLIKSETIEESLLIYRLTEFLFEFFDEIEVIFA